MTKLLQPQFNQGQNTWEIDVPGIGSCLFWAVALAYLIPVKNNDHRFQKRFKKLFGQRPLEKLEHVKNWIRTYNPFSMDEATHQDEALNGLVKEEFRARVFEHMANNRSQFEGYIEGRFEDYLNNIQNRNTWGGEPEITAMSDLLDCHIQIITTEGELKTYGEEGTPIQLFHAGALPGSQEANHYHFGLDKNIGDVLKAMVGKAPAKRMNIGSEDSNLKKPRTPTSAEEIVQELDHRVNKRSHEEGKPASQAKKTKSTRVDQDNAEIYETYEISGGLKSSTHGDVYQLKLLMLFLHRGIEHGYHFKLATEREGVGAFDDVFFEQDNWRICLQAKHKLDEKDTITYGKLFPPRKDKSEGAFALQKYFVSYLEAKLDAINESKEVKDLIICTNVDFAFKGSGKLIGQGGKYLLFDKIAINDYEILDAILNVPSNKKEPAFYKFSNEEAERKKLVSELELEDVDAKLKPEFKNDLKKVGIDIPAEVGDFLNQLIFAVNQPDEIELGERIKEEVGKKLKLIDSDFVYDDFQVKLLDWFKEKVGTYQTDERGKRFFEEAEQRLTKIIQIGPSLEYRAKIKEFSIQFNDISIELQRFFDKSGIIEKQIFNLIIPNGATFLGSIKVAQVLQDSHDYRENDSYIFMRLSSILRLQDRVINTFKSKNSHHLLIIDCKSAESENKIKQLYEALRDIVESEPIKKIILITQVNDALASLFNSGSLKYKEKRDEKNDLINLALESQNTVLKEKVLFQGKAISLCDLIDEKSKKLVNATVLSQLLNKETIQISTAPPSLGEIQDYYIPRTWNRKIKKEQLKQIEENYLSDLFAISGIQENELVQLLFGESRAEKRRQKIRRFEEPDPNKNYPIRFILLEEKTAAVNFQQIVQDYPSHTIHWLKKENRELVWQQFKPGSGQLLGEAGGYKPEKVTDLPERIVIISDTAGIGKSTVLTHLAVETKKVDYSLWVARVNLVDYLKQLSEANFDGVDEVISFLSTTLGLKTLLEKRLLRHRITQQGKITLLFDGFDEISPAYKEKVIQLLQILKNTAAEKLWVTTRPHMQSNLESKLNVFAYTLKPFSFEDQQRFLKQFWGKKLKISSINEERLKTYTKELIERVAHSIRDKEKEFTGIPLQTRMLAEAFQGDFKEYHSFTEKLPKLPEELELLELYQRFIGNKYKIYYEEKMQIDIRNPGAEFQYERFFETDMQEHKRLALQLLFPDQARELWPIPNKQLPEEELARIGIVQIINKQPHFIHRTFAEYFLAALLVDCLSKKQSDQYNRVLIFLKEQLFKEENDVIRHFLDRLLAHCHEMHNAVLKGDEIEFKRLLATNSAHTTEADYLGRIPLHLAASRGHKAIIEQLIGQEGSIHTADQLGEYPLSYTVLSRKEDAFVLILREVSRIKSQQNLNASIQWVVQRRQRKILELLISYDYVNRTQVEAMLNANNYGAFQIAVQHGDSSIVDSLWLKATSKQQQGMRNSIDAGRAFQMAVQRGDFSMVNSLWSKASTEQQQEMWQGIEAVSAFQTAVQRGDGIMVDCLWSKASTKQQEMMWKGIDAISAFQTTVQRGNGIMLNKLWSRASAKQQQAMWEDIDVVGAFRTAIQSSRVFSDSMVDSLWSKATSKQQEEMLEANNYEAFRIAVQGGNIHSSIMVNSLWSKATSKQQEEMLEANNYEAFQTAVQRGDPRIVDRLWSKATSEQQGEMWNSIDAVGTFQTIVKRNEFMMIDCLWSKATSKQQEEMLEANNYEAFQTAVQRGDSRIVDNLWSKATSKQQQGMRNSIDAVRAFQKAVQRGGFSMVNSLWLKASTKQQQEMWKGIDAVSEFQTAVQRGDSRMIDSLWSKASSKQQTAMLNSIDAVSIFLTAIQRGYSNVGVSAFQSFIQIEIAHSMVESLWLKASADKRQAILEANNYGVFQAAVQHGFSKMVESLWSEAISEQKLKMWNSIDAVGAFQTAVQSRNSEMIDSLWLKATSKQQDEMLEANNYEAFQTAVQHGDSSIVDSLWSKATSKQQQKMWNSINAVGAFQKAIQYGPYNMVDRLKAHRRSKATFEQQQVMLKINNYRAFQTTVQYVDPKAYLISKEEFSFGHNF